MTSLILGVLLSVGASAFGLRQLKSLTRLFRTRVPPPDPDDYLEVLYRRRIQLRRRLGQERFEGMEKVIASGIVLAVGAFLIADGVIHLIG